MLSLALLAPVVELNFGKSEIIVMSPPFALIATPPKLKFTPYVYVAPGERDTKFRFNLPT